MVNGTFEAPKTEERSYSGLSKIDTINNIGSIMTSRMMSGIQKSLKKVNENADDYTPIAASTKDLFKELQLSTQFGTVDEGAFDYYFTDGTNKDASGYGTALGRSLVINSPFQFNQNDDVRSDKYFPHLGRVFNEKIFSNYPIAIFEVGKIKYNTNLLTNTGADTSENKDNGIASMIRGDTIVGSGIAMVKTVLKTTWGIATFPVTALLGLRKFAVFQQQTRLYEKYVNDMMITIATMMGLMSPEDPNDEGEKIDFSEMEDKNDYTSANFNNPDDDVEKVGDTGESTGEATEGKKFDNYAGRLTRLRLKNLLPTVTLSSYDYIPFLVHKDISVTENIGNSSQQNPLQSTLNGIAAEAESSKVNNNMSGQGANVLDDLKTALTDKMKNVANMFMRGESGTVVSGEGRIALPEVWTDSSFGRSVSMSFKFTSPYGNDLAIFENTYIPFILLFCMSMPRQIGTKIFTSPFIVRVSVKGMFSIPMGIIESMSIERGEERNSWNTSDRPRTIKVNLSIKDITPTMMMSMNRGIFFPLFASNDGFTSYLNTIGGLSIKSQLDVKNKLKMWWTKVDDRIKSMQHLATAVGNGALEVVGVKEKDPNTEDSTVIINFRDFPIVKQYVSVVRFLGIQEGNGSSIRDAM